VIGLGNFFYPELRHSIGYLMVDKIAKHLNLEWSYNKKDLYWITERGNFYLVKPRTYLVRDNKKTNTSNFRQI